MVPLRRSWRRAWWWTAVAVGLLATGSVPLLHGSSPNAPQTLTIAGGAFQLGGKPFQILSGEMHYPRVPREYWRDRMKKARAMGLNTISTYVFWNLHEPRRGVFDFAGPLDVAAYVRTAQEEGLHVILRPGPYVCAEWDLGGLPAWLLADRSIVLRSGDEKFVTAAEQFLKRLGRELAPLQSTRGGPIIAIQVENEYGSFDSDAAYMRRIKDAIVSAGLGEALLYTADGPPQLPAGSLPDLPAVVNFGPGGAQGAFAALRKFRPDGPLMSGEYWAGWFDQWGQNHARTNADQQAREIDWMLGQGGSVNLYMFHGGTTFGFMNGANLDRTYRPQTSSYDYDAALDESGRPAPKYALFRDVIAKRFPDLKIPDVPVTPAPITIAPVTLADVAPLWSALPSRRTTADGPLSMEALGQSYGYVLYRTKVAAATKGDLALNDLRDYAIVFVNGTRVSTLDRRINQNTAAVDVPAGATIDILVENTGRINFKKDLRQERKGVGDTVTLAGQSLSGWTMFSLPMSDLSSLRFASTPASGPAFYRGSLQVDAPGDTFLDMRGWDKGVVWVNGHNLGRFWRVGPQQTMYVPGPWLKRGRNEIVVFELGEGGAHTVAGLAAPVFGGPAPAGGR